MNHHAHLLEERLFSCYLAERNGEIIDPPLAEHLADCEPCAVRYGELAAFIDALHAAGVAEADAAFDADRLRAQQRQIARRLELAGHPARVISFPRRFVARTMTPAASHAAPRWVAAAAAAGLLIGAAVGATYGFGPFARAPQQSAARAASAAQGPNAAGAGRAPIVVDEAFLSDLEMAMERPHTRELQAFEALTPHVREVGLRR